MSALTLKSQPETQVTQAAPISGAMIITAGQPVPQPVETAIGRLLAGFPAGAAQTNEDRQLVLMNYREACDGFPLAIVVYTLQQLRRFNPRNPFAPTSQDVFEHCEKAERLFRSRVHAWLFRGSARSDDPKPVVPQWGSPKRKSYFCMKTFKSVENLPRFGDDWGPEPLKAGCYLSRDLICQWLRELLEDPENHERFVSLSDELKARIPEECWSEESRANTAASLSRFGREA